MLPAFLADQGDLVEVMLELNDESMVVGSVTPTAAAAVLYAPMSLGGGAGGARTPDNGARSLSRCSSTMSRIRRKFVWLRSPSPSPSKRHHPLPPAAAVSDSQAVREAALAAHERRREQALRLNRSRSGARRALKGLRFISRTTMGSSAAAVVDDAGGELWRRVEKRFNARATGSCAPPRAPPHPGCRPAAHPDGIAAAAALAPAQPRRAASRARAGVVACGGAPSSASGTQDMDGGGGRASQSRGGRGRTRERKKSGAYGWVEMEGLQI